jgi:hypothetical protein
MPTTPPPPFVFDHVPGFEIATKYKEAIRELYSFGEKSTAELMERYKLGKPQFIIFWRIMHRSELVPVEPVDHSF